MDWKDAVSLIEKEAPLVGGLLGGPAGAALGAGASGIIHLVASSLGCEPTQDAITATIAADPASALKLKELELTHSETFQKLLLQQTGMYLTDTQSARDRDSKFIEKGKTNWRADIMLFLITAGLVAICWLLVAKHIDGSTAAGGFLLAVGGAFLKDLSQAFNFEFGTTRESSDKTDMISKLPALNCK